MFKSAKFFFDKFSIRSFILKSSQIIKILMNRDKSSNNKLCWFWYKTILWWTILWTIKWIIKLSTTSKTFRLTLFFCFFSFFRILVSVFYSSFRCFFSFFVIILSIIFDLETSFLSVSVEKTIQKIFCTENVIETNIFVAIVFDSLQIISSNKITISNRNAEKKSLEWANFFCERKFKWRRTTTFWCYVVVVVVVVWRFEVRRSKNRFFCWFLCFAHWAENNDIHSSLMRVLHCSTRCVKSTFLCVRVANNINCKRCAN